MGVISLAQHAVVAPAGRREVEAFARVKGLALAEAGVELEKMRIGMMEAEKGDPLRYGYEPPAWKIADALLGFDCHDEGWLKHLQARFDKGWDWWAGRIRELLGLGAPVKMLLVMGGNRSSKSEYAGKRVVERCYYYQGQNVVAAHFSRERSAAEQQPLVWKYFPREWRMKEVKSATTYIAYKAKTGFSEDSFIAPSGSACRFKYYTQDSATALEGTEPNLMAPDELVPVEWIETIPYRLITRDGRAIFTFTPIHGYTPSVQVFCEGGRVVREGTAFLLPRDGGRRDEARALGLSEEEWVEVRLAAQQKRTCLCPQSRPEDCGAWLEEGSEEWRGRVVRRPFGYGQAQPAPEAGRLFERMPRVMLSHDPRKAVLWLWGGDNPFGNPKETVLTVRKAATDDVKVRFYGFTRKAIANKFPRASRRIHVWPDGEIPPGGRTWMTLDPAGDRNPFMCWIRECEGFVAVVREWPGSYWIPTVGIPGPWTIASGRKGGMNDGARGDGQENFGFGLLRLKLELARLELWDDLVRWVRDEGLELGEGLRQIEQGELYPDEEALREWDEGNGMRENVVGRVLDSRAASEPRMEADRPTTLREDFAEIGLEFDLAPGTGIGDGVQAINSALDWREREIADSGLRIAEVGKGDGEEFTRRHEGHEGEGGEELRKAQKARKGEFEISDFRSKIWAQLEVRPKLVVAESCRNVWYSIENWRWADGLKGASKDPIDGIRWFFSGDLQKGGGHGLTVRGGFARGVGRGGGRVMERVAGRGKLARWSR